MPSSRYNDFNQQVKEVGILIYNLSGRTDIVGFYYPWFLNRLAEGFVDVRHPFNPKMVYRFSLNPSSVDAFVICTKNPLPLLKQPDPLFPYCNLIQVTLTPYGKDLEPNVPAKKEIIAAVKSLSHLFGKEHLFVRYDPIVITSKYSCNQHIQSFEHLVFELKDYVHCFIISFVDEYKNTKKHDISSPTEQQMRTIAEGFGKIALKYGVKVQTCAEVIDLDAFGISHGLCLDPAHLTKLTGQALEWVSEKSKREHCACADYRDIGAYNSCLHFCKYCYANYDENQIWENYHQHDPKSSLLIGHLSPDDQVVKVDFKSRQMRLF